MKPHRYIALSVSNEGTVLFKLGFNNICGSSFCGITHFPMWLKEMFSTKQKL